MKRVEIGGDLVERLAFEGKLEQSGRIAARYAGTGICLACHLKRLFLPNGRLSSRLVPGPECPDPRNDGIGASASTG